MATKATLNGVLLFPSEYISSIELKGKDVCVKIAAVRFESLIMRAKNGKVVKQNKPVLSFERTRKRMVLNSTNSGTIADMHGTDADHWVGKLITLYPTVCDVGREKNVPCIRVRDTRPRTEPTGSPDFPEPEQRPDADDEIFGAAAEDAPPQQPAAPEAQQDAAEAEQDRMDREELARITKLKQATSVTATAPVGAVAPPAPSGETVVAQPPVEQPKPPEPAPTPAPAKPELTIDQALDLPWSECNRFLRETYAKVTMGPVPISRWSSLMNKTFAKLKETAPDLLVDETFPQTNIGAAWLPKFYAAIVDKSWPVLMG